MAAVVTSWRAVARAAPIPLPDQVYDHLVAAYADPPRAYHTFAHVVDVLEHWHDVQRRLGWQHPGETFLAVLFHDAIYQAGRSDNEERSALLAISQVPQQGVDLELVTRLIRLTAQHGRLTPALVDPEAALFLDCDMAILGAAPATFGRYEEDIGREYAHLPAAVYAAGRRKFLQTLLAAPRIFLSEDFHRRLEERARANLRRSWERLSHGSEPDPSTHR